ncbi:hypothetical protein [Burkholderia sp. Bp8990]|uniref:hypothetical protein n=1 Tax=Burkholderia sp. Bp8990 TaxID=2184552 RepID=UPI00162776DB|nr:hypothetical protein [Burkholderia sp. Bp8990]
MPNDNVLTDEQILKIVRQSLKGGNDRDKLSSESFVKLYAAFEEAILGESVGVAGTMPGTDAWTTGVFPADHVPEGSLLYALKEKHHG